MNDLITPLESIKAELTQIQEFVEITMSEDATEAVHRGNDLVVYMARTGKLLADCKYHRDRKLNSEVVQNLKTILSLPATSANKLMDSLCFEENYLMNWCERLNRACTHQVDWSRTLISKAKAEMQYQ